MPARLSSKPKCKRKGSGRVLPFANRQKQVKFKVYSRNIRKSIRVVRIGSTPPFMFKFDIPEGVTEIRPGTYIFIDASQSNLIGTYDRCAASVLTTVISKPTKERVITDVGAKGITAQTRSEGLTATYGLGRIKEYEVVYIHGVFDEHAIIYHEEFNKKVSIGDKVRIIPNHICPVCNLHDKAYLVHHMQSIGGKEQQHTFSQHNTVLLLLILIYLRLRRYPVAALVFNFLNLASRSYMHAVSSDHSGRRVFQQAENETDDTEPGRPHKRVINTHDVRVELRLKAPHKKSREQSLPMCRSTSLQSALSLELKQPLK